MLPATNATSPKQLTDYIILAETIALPDGYTSEPFEGVKGDGTKPASANVACRGIITLITDSQYGQQGAFATVATEGIAIAKVNPGATISADDDVAINASGWAVSATTGNAVVGQARDNSSGSTSQAPHYIRIKLGRSTK